MRVDCFLTCFTIFVLWADVSRASSERIPMGRDAGYLLLECVCLCFCWIPQAHFHTNCSVTKSCLTLPPHGLQHARIPCLHYLPEFAQTHVLWVSDAINISSSTSRFSFCLQSSHSWRLFQWVFQLGSQSIGASASELILPMNILGWVPLGLTGLISLLSKGLSGVFPNTLVQSLSVRFFVTPGMHHARPPCPSPTPKACSNSCPSSKWCHPTISSSVVPFSSCLQSFPASGSFPVSQLFTSGGQSTGASASSSVLPMNIQDWFLLRLTGLISLQFKGFSWVFSNTTVRKHHFLGAQLSSWSNSHIHT